MPDCNFGLIIVCVASLSTFFFATKELLVSPAFSPLHHGRRLSLGDPKTVTFKEHNSNNAMLSSGYGNNVVDSMQEETRGTNGGMQQDGTEQGGIVIPYSGNTDSGTISSMGGAQISNGISGGTSSTGTFSQSLSSDRVSPDSDGFGGVEPQGLGSKFMSPTSGATRSYASIQTGGKTSGGLRAGAVSTEDLNSDGSESPLMESTQSGGRSSVASARTSGGLRSGGIQTGEFTSGEYNTQFMETVHSGGGLDSNGADPQFTKGTQSGRSSDTGSVMASGGLRSGDASREYLSYSGSKPPYMETMQTGWLTSTGSGMTSSDVSRGDLSYSGSKTPFIETAQTGALTSTGSGMTSSRLNPGDMTAEDLSSSTQFNGLSSTRLGGTFGDSETPFLETSQSWGMSSTGSGMKSNGLLPERMSNGGLRSGGSGTSLMESTQYEGLSSTDSGMKSGSEDLDVLTSADSQSGPTEEALFVDIQSSDLSSTSRSRTTFDNDESEDGDRGSSSSFSGELQVVKTPFGGVMQKESFGTVQQGSDQIQKPRRKLEFVHITKTGGTAIETAAADQAKIMWGACHYRSISYQKCDNPDWPKVEKRIAERMPPGLFYQGEPWHCPHHWQLPNMFEEVDTFAVVRNPYERVVSEYYCSAYGYKGPDPDKVETFQNWVTANVTEVARDIRGHMLPQNYYVYDLNGDKVITHVLHYENLSNEFDALMQEYGISIKLPSKGDSAPMFHTYDHSKQYQGESGSKHMTVNDLSPENIQTINKIYARDFELFGYNMIQI